MPRISRPSAVNTPVTNPLGVVYLIGSENVDGSIRILNDSETAAMMIERRESGLWQKYSLETAPGTVWVGREVGLAGVGHHLAIETRAGHMRFSALSEWDKDTLLSVKDTRVLNAYAAGIETIFQPDVSGLFTGTSTEFSFPSAGHLIAKKIYYKTGPTAAGAPIHIEIFKGVDDTGVKISDQWYATNLFPANSDISVIAEGFIEYEASTTYFLRYTSTQPFSFIADATNTVPYFAADWCSVREDELLQTEQYSDGGTYAVGQWLITNRKIYLCNTAGVQTGTFESNSDKWDLLTTGDLAIHSIVTDQLGNPFADDNGDLVHIVT